MGVTVGMAVNNVCSNLTARGMELSPKRIFEEASDILRVVQRLERGEFAPKYSERQKASGAQGERLKEATAINKSLSALGNVIMSLVDQQHVSV